MHNELHREIAELVDRGRIGTSNAYMLAQHIPTKYQSQFKIIAITANARTLKEAIDKWKREQQ
jgi:hypothetical protein